jgi:hypothetical protein
MFDQEVNLQRVEALGAGLRLPMRDCRAERLRAAVETIIDNPAYTEAARRLQRRIAAFDGPRGAALHIEHFLRTGDPTARPETRADHRLDARHEVRPGADSSVEADGLHEREVVPAAL